MFSTLILGLLTLTRKHKLLMDYMLLLRREARMIGYDKDKVSQDNMLV